MKHQIDFVASRDGDAAAHDYAKRTLRAYRNAARLRDAAGRRHYAHESLFRKSFVSGIREIRAYLTAHHRGRYGGG